MTRQEWEKDRDNGWPQIVFLNAIGAYCIGDPIEHSEAKAYLLASSGRDCTDPSLCLKYWRNRFFGVKY
jgi:hypothetical protein